jgi:hypothetical protein
MLWHLHKEISQETYKMTNDKKYKESAFRAMSDGRLTPGVESGRPAKSTRAGPRVVADLRSPTCPNGL